MKFKRTLWIIALSVTGVAHSDTLNTYTESVGALNKFLVDHPDLRTYDEKKCEINIQSEWRAETKKLKILVQLMGEGSGEIANFSIDSISNSETSQSHLLTSSNPLRLNVINYGSDEFNHWTESSKVLQLSPYSIRIVDIDPGSGEPLSQVACSLPNLPLMYKNL